MKKILLKISGSVLSKEDMKKVKGGYPGTGPWRLWVHNNCGDGMQYETQAECCAAIWNYPDGGWEAKCGLGSYGNCGTPVCSR